MWGRHDANLRKRMWAKKNRFVPNGTFRGKSGWCKSMSSEVVGRNIVDWRMEEIVEGLWYKKGKVWGWPLLRTFLVRIWDWIRSQGGRERRRHRRSCGFRRVWRRTLCYHEITTSASWGFSFLVFKRQRAWGSFITLLKILHLPSWWFQILKNKILMVFIQKKYIF